MRVALCTAEALLLLLAAGAGCSQQPWVVVHTQRGPVTVEVEVADTPEKRAQGLMYRRDLARDAGMLFAFPAESEQHFWMKNTPLPLDMIFIGANRRIVGIVANTRPFSERLLSVGDPTRYVLEVHAGFCARKGIITGDRVEFVRVEDAAR